MYPGGQQANRPIVHAQQQGIPAFEIHLGRPAPELRQIPGRIEFCIQYRVAGIHFPSEFPDAKCL